MNAESRPIRRRIIAGIVAATFVACLGAPVPAMAAESLTITPPLNPAAETTVPVGLSGETNALSPEIELYASAGASTCDQFGTEYLNTGDPHASVFVPSPEPISFNFRPFSVTASLEIAQPGPYLLCGYLDSLVRATAAMTVGPSAAALAAQAKQEAEAKAREVAERDPATALTVKVSQHRRNSAKNPGYTMLLVTASPYARVTITVDHHGGIVHSQLEPGLSRGIEIGWSCRHPTLTYHYAVTAVGGSGPPLRRSGSFRVPLSASTCRALRIAEAHRIAARHRQERREAEEEKRREKSPQFKIEHAEREYCEKVLNGSPGEPFTAAGHIYTRCESRPGGEPEVTVSETDIRG